MSSFGSYGLDQCIDLVEKRLAKGGGVPKPEGADWLEGTGMALAMLDCGPPTEHRSGSGWRCCADGTYHLAVGSTEMGNGSVTSHRQIAAESSARGPAMIAIINADTDKTPYDTGTFASTGTVVAGQAVAHDARRRCATTSSTIASRNTGVDREDCRLEDDAVVCGNTRISLTDLYAAGKKSRPPLRRKRKAYVSPRTIAFNVHGIRLAVHQRHGRDPHPAERACRRYRPADQPDAMPRPDRRRRRHGLSAGRWTRTWFTMPTGTVVNPQLRNYRIPAFADTPHTEVHLRRHPRQDRPARSQIPGRMRDQPRRAGHRQRARQRHRHALCPSAVHA